MQRRTFIALFGAAAVPWPFAARAQQAMPTVGFIRSSAEAGFDHLVAAFRLGLSDAGYVDGRTIKIELRWCDGSKERLSTLATELVRNDVKVIVGNASAMEAVMAATKTVPIVFVSGNDPVTGGLVANLHRPGGNITGVSYFEVPLAAKRLELLTELLPKAGNIAALINPNFTGAQSEQQHLETAARAMGRKMLIVSASTEDAIDGAFAQLTQANIDALLVGGSPFFVGRRRQITTLALRHAMPAIYVQREYVQAGGLASYGASQIDAYRRAGSYVSRILKGERPGDLPVELPSKFELIINRQTAKALGIEIPTKLLFTADDVIE
jgi:putative tryptophan/tyrosine transport system substrate-binding protein